MNSVQKLIQEDTKNGVLLRPLRYIAIMNRTYDDWKTTDTLDTGSVEDSCGRDCEGCPDCSVVETTGTIVKSDLRAISGTVAATAIMMADMFPDFDWDAWKEETKNNGF